MIRSFKDRGTKDVFFGADTRHARNTCPAELRLVARKRLDRIHAATQLLQLRTPPGNQLEALRGERLGQFSIRINGQFRVCFRWVGGDAEDVEIVDYH
jgi:proteic killer suppression protein